MRIGELIQQLASKDKKQRDAAADQLIQAGAEAVGRLLDLLRDPDRKTPPAVSYIPTRIGRPAFWSLVVAVAASSPGEHWEPCRVLHGFNADLVEDYAVALGHASPWVRLAAAIGLNRLGSDALPAAPALVARLNDPDPDVREQVIFALNYIGEGVIPTLQEVRAHGPGHLRASALTAPAEVGGEAALRPEDRAALERLLRIKLLNERAEAVGDGLCGVWLAIPGGDQQARFGQAQSYWYDGQFGFSNSLICMDGDVRRYFDWSDAELSIGEQLPVEASMRLPHEEAQIPEEERAALDALVDECLGDLDRYFERQQDRYFERQQEVYDRYGVPPICNAFDIAAAMSVSPTRLGPQTEAVGHGLLALTSVGRGIGVPTRGAFPI